MPDIRTNGIMAQIFFDIACPLFTTLIRPLFYSLKLAALPLLLHGTLSLLVPFIFFFYIQYKKVQHERTFLRKIYLPSWKLYVVFFIVNSILAIILWAVILYNDIYSIASWVMLLTHVIFSLVAFYYTYKKSNKYRVRISSFHPSSKLGVMGRQIGEDSEHGLKRGEIVVIVKMSTSGCVVKNSRGEEYSVALSDIEDIIELRDGLSSS